MFHLKKWRHRNLHYSASNYTVIQWQNLNSVLIIPIKSAKGKGIECADVGECRVGIWIVKGHKGMRSIRRLWEIFLQEDEINAIPDMFESTEWRFM